MENNTIVEHYTLPSKGKVYDKVVNPEISLSSMTTEHEMRRLSPNSESQYKNLCEIIDDCILTEDVGISSYDMCLGDYLFLLQKLRVVTYGKDYKIVSTCSHCGSENQHTVDLDKIKVLEFNEKEFNKHSQFKLPRSGKEVRIRVKTPRMMDKVRKDALEFKGKANLPYDTSLAFLILNMIETVDGKPLNEIDGLDWIRKLPAADAVTILNHSDALNNGIGTNLIITNSCTACGLKYKTMLRTSNEFFRPALD